MSLCKSTVDDLSPPATPPSSSSSSSSTASLDMTGRQLTSMLDKSRMDYVGRVKHTFQQFTQQQKHVFLAELLSCCDNQLLAFVHTLIVPKLKIDFLQQLPPELALHVLSFVDDPRTLARAARVSRYWSRLLQDESMWKALCIKHRLEKRLPSQPSYRDYFRRRYNIDNAWHHGGRIISCRNSIGTALVTSLQVDGPYIVAGCDNQRIEVYCSSTGKHLRSLLGHGGGVWSLQFMKEEDSDEYLLVSGGCDRYADLILCTSTNTDTICIIVLLKHLLIFPSYPITVLYWTPGKRAFGSSPLDVSVMCCAVIRPPSAASRCATQSLL